LFEGALALIRVVWVGDVAYRGLELAHLTDHKQNAQLLVLCWQQQRRVVVHGALIR
jgi:hypothetical protein